MITTIIVTNLVDWTIFTPVVAYIGLRSTRFFIVCAKCQHEPPYFQYIIPNKSLELNIFI